MNPIKLIIGRRQFIIASAVSLMTPVIGRVSRALGADIETSGTQAAEGKKAIKGCVVYYSATGSTAKAARAIYKGMKSVIECDIFPIKKAKAKDMKKYDVIAMGSPIWYNRETLNLDLFILDMPNMTGKYFIPFCTHGVGPNGFMYNLMRAAFKRGLTLLGWADWYGSVFHVLHQPKPYYTDGHPDKQDLAEAEAFGRAMAERAQKVFDGQTDLIPEVPDSNSDSIWRPQKMERPGAMAAMMGAMGGAGGQAGGQQGGMPEGMSGGAGGQQGDMPGGMLGGESGGQGGMPGEMPTGAGGQQGGAPGGMPGGEAGQQSGRGEGPGQDGGQSGPGGSSGGQSSAPGMGMSTMGTGYYPEIDLTKCIYPRCRLCMDVCVQNAIDLTRITAQPGFISGADVLVKSACIQCKYPECQRACKYEAIIYKSATTKHEFDMTKCTYPKCTLCIDECLMDAIYVSDGKLMARNNCEGCDVCYCICPTGAVTIPNIADTVHAGSGDREIPSDSSRDAQGGGRGEGRSEGGAGGQQDSRAQGNMSGATTMQQGVSSLIQNVGGSTANITGKREFRSLVKSEDIGRYYRAVLNVTHRPILELQEDDWPIMRDVDGNIIPNDYNS